LKDQKTLGILLYILNCIFYNQNFHISKEILLASLQEIDVALPQGSSSVVGEALY